jgi:hypothetical protein
MLEEAYTFATKIAYSALCFNGGLFIPHCPNPTYGSTNTQPLRMLTDVRAALVSLCRRVLFPLVRILIRFGISAGELKSIVDSAYAQVGSEYLETQGERVTFTRLAVITGLNRSFIPSILAARPKDFQPRSGTQLHRAARVLAGWHDDPMFQGARGVPAVLRLSGGASSFRNLARRYSGGVYYQTMLSELLRVGAVRRVGLDRVRALRRSAVSSGANIESLYSAGETAGDLLATLEHNLTAPAHEMLPVRSLALRVDARSLPLFRTQLTKRADGLLEIVDAFLQSQRSDARENVQTHRDHSTVTLGATVFGLCRVDSPTTDSRGKKNRKAARAEHR